MTYTDELGWLREALRLLDGGAADDEDDLEPRRPTRARRSVPTIVVMSTLG